MRKPLERLWFDEKITEIEPAKVEWRLPLWLRQAQPPLLLVFKIVLSQRLAAV